MVNATFQNLSLYSVYVTTSFFHPYVYIYRENRYVFSKRKKKTRTKQQNDLRRVNVAVSRRVPFFFAIRKNFLVSSVYTSTFIHIVKINVHSRRKQKNKIETTTTKETKDSRSGSILLFFSVTD